MITFKTVVCLHCKRTFKFDKEYGGLLTCPYCGKEVTEKIFTYKKEETK
jgi:DNA-directed RNA polymerase subunit RPC12/RpoP